MDFKLNSNTVCVNGEDKQMDALVTVHEKRTVVPLREFLELMGRQFTIE